jgi:hypothetical protein
MDLDNQWGDPMPILTMPLEPVPPAFPPPIIAKTKSSSSAKSRKRKEPRACTIPVERDGGSSGGQTVACTADEHRTWA